MLYVPRIVTYLLPSGNFPGEGDAISFRDAIDHKYFIKMPKQYVILLRIERRARWWRFHFDTVNNFGDIDL